MAWFGKRGFALMTMLMALCGGCLGAVYNVGDAAGWTIRGIDYDKWASANTFHVGDTLVFTYNKEFHDVVQVTKEDYESCSATKPIASFSSGSDSIPLQKSGDFYFLCGVPGHCQAGQKVQISVTTASSSSSPPTDPEVPPSEAPVPHRSGAVSLRSSVLPLAIGVLTIGVASFAFY